jgi:hypothetical protein
MQTISAVLTKNPKQSMLVQALLFSQVKISLKNCYTKYFPLLQADFENSKTFVTDWNNILNVKICSRDNLFLTFLKTEKMCIAEFLQAELEAKNLLRNKSLKLEIIFR